jgi:hypothetical protein
MVCFKSEDFDRPINSVKKCEEQLAVPYGRVKNLDGPSRRKLGSC